METDGMTDELTDIVIALETPVPDAGFLFNCILGRNDTVVPDVTAQAPAPPAPSA
jgi:hypothetical protein